MKTLIRLVVAGVLAAVVTRGISYAFYLLVGSRILSAGGHIPDSPLPMDFIAATSGMDFAAGMIAGLLIARIVPAWRRFAAAIIGAGITLILLAQMSSPHWNEWAMQFVPFLGIQVGVTLSRKRGLAPGGELVAPRERGHSDFPDARRIE